MREFEDNSHKINEKKCGIYIHIPFCRKKCLYCDFFSGGAKEIDWELFARSVINELRERKGELNGMPSTLYIGGGTPSLMPVETLQRMVKQLCDIVGKCDEWDEFTLEINPEDVTERNCEVWRECGVNRVSMGIQTLNDAELKAIGRTHTSAAALDGLRMLKSYFDNVTLDLIFGLPGQTLESWRVTVEAVIAEKPQHISAYSLMFEEGTALTVLRNQGKLKFPDEEECLAMWSYLVEALSQKGYKQYEISNYALPGWESVHNRRYWLGNPYLGLGPSAHSYDGERTRRANLNDIRGYLARFGAVEARRGEAREKGDVGEKVFFYNEEILTREELIEEKIMLSLRMAEGIDLEAFRAKFGEKDYARLLKAAKREVEIGNLILVGGRMYLTKAGVMISDEVILELM